MIHFRSSAVVVDCVTSASMAAAAAVGVENVEYVESNRVESRDE